MSEKTFCVYDASYQPHWIFILICATDAVVTLWVAMSLLRTPLALTRWTWSRSSFNMVNYQNFCSLPATTVLATSKGNLQALNNKLPPQRSLCTSNNVKTSAGNDDVKNASPSSSKASNSSKATKLPEIKSMPSGLTDLVTKTSEPGWPSLQNISQLALRFKYRVVVFLHKYPPKKLKYRKPR